MLVSKRLFKSFQRPSMHCFRLFIFPLLVKHITKLTDTGKRVRMLVS
jgi:hypothetical protein